MAETPTEILVQSQNPHVILLPTPGLGHLIPLIDHDFDFDAGDIKEAVLMLHFDLKKQRNSESIEGQGCH
ncbi:hypothetical protein P3L10_005460 [Capsicum annuum]